MANMGDYFSVLALFILFRETIEASIICSVLLQFLNRARPPLKRTVWIGVASGVGVSIIFGVIFITLYYTAQDNLFQGKNRAWFKGIICWIAGVLITILAFAMLRFLGWEEKWKRRLNEALAKKVQVQNAEASAEGAGEELAATADPAVGAGAAAEGAAAEADSPTSAGAIPSPAAASASSSGEHTLSRSDDTGVSSASTATDTDCSKPDGKPADCAAANGAAAAVAAAPGPLLHCTSSRSIVVPGSPRKPAAEALPYEEVPYETGPRAGLSLFEKDGFVADAEAKRKKAAAASGSAEADPEAGAGAELALPAEAEVVAEQVDMSPPNKKERWEIFVLVFTTVVREGIESVVFLGGLGNVKLSAIPLAAFVGIVSGCLLGVFLYYTGKQVRHIKWLIIIMAIIIFFIAAGQINIGTDSLMTAGAFGNCSPWYDERPWFMVPIYDWSACCNDQDPTGTEPTSEQNSRRFFALARAIFGYQDKGTPIEIIVYCCYWGVVIIIALFKWWRGTLFDADYKYTREQRRLKENAAKKAELDAAAAAEALDAPPAIAAAEGGEEAAVEGREAAAVEVAVDVGATYGELKEAEEQKPLSWLGRMKAQARELAARGRAAAAGARS